jgi:hypothetical protein
VRTSDKSNYIESESEDSDEIILKRRINIGIVKCIKYEELPPIKCRPIRTRIIDTSEDMELLLHLLQTHELDRFWKNSNQLMRQLPVQFHVPNGINSLPNEAYATTIVLCFLHKYLTGIEEGLLMMYS